MKYRTDEHDLCVHFMHFVQGTVKSQTSKRCTWGGGSWPRHQVKQTSLLNWLSQSSRQSQFGMGPGTNIPLHKLATQSRHETTNGDQKLESGLNPTW